MFKKLFKTRRDVLPSGVVEAPRLQHSGMSEQTPSYSTNPVDYRCSGPTYNPSPAYSVTPVEYNQSPLDLGRSPTNTHAMLSVTPVDYAMSAPVAPQPQPCTPPAPREIPQINVVENPHRPSKQPPAPTSHAQLPLPSTIQSQKELAYVNTKRTSYAPPAEPINVVKQKSVELPGSPVPPRYELPTVYTPKASIDPGLHTLTDTSTTFGSTTTLVPSPRSTQHSSPPKNTNKGTIPSPIRSEDDGIKKFVVDIYCPLKKQSGGARREQIPRDVREFRLAKVALIPIVAGKRSFVSFDVVFGEVDKAFSDLVEKHFSFYSQTRVTKLDAEAVHGGDVYTIGPLNIAYRDGDRSTVYMKFPSPEDENRFKATFLDMWKYVEQTTD